VSSLPLATEIAVFALLFDALGHLPASLEDMDLSELDSNIMESGWWFGTLFIFPYVGKNHPN
jgi:hypothetical protein